MSVISGSRLRPATHLERAAFAFMAPATAGGPEAALRALHGHDPASLHVLALARSAVAPTTTTDLAGIIAGAAVSDFLASLGPDSAAARLLAEGAVRVDLGGATKLTLPTRVGGPPAAVPLVREAQPIPVVSGSLGVVLRRAKVAGIVELSNEVAASAAGEAIFRAKLREDIAPSLDAALFSTDPGDEETPDGLLAAASVVDAGADPLADAEALGAAVLAAGGVRVAFVAAPTTAFRLAMRLPQQALTIWPSLAVAEGRLIALDPAAVVAAVDPAPRFDSSQHALLVEADPAAAVSDGGGVAAPLRSLFQTDMLGLRVVLGVAWALRAPAVAMIPAVNWA